MLIISEIKPMIYKGVLTKYFISDDGTIYKKNMKPKKAHLIKGGYLRVGISINGKHKCVLVHRLVAENFIGPIADGMEVDHLNGDKTNNSIYNLEIVTPEENMRRAVKNNLILQGNSRSATKYDEDTIRKICEKLESETDKKKIAEELNVPAELVRSIACGIKWRFISREYNILPSKKRHKYTKEEIDKILMLYKSGKTYQEIAKLMGLTYNNIISVIQKYAIKRNKPHHKYSDDEDKLILSMKESGYTNKEIAIALKLTESSIASRFKCIKQHMF